MVIIAPEPAFPRARTARKLKPDKKAKAAKTAKHKTEPEAAKATGIAVPAGPLHIIVSVAAQRAALYANGAFVAATKVSTGTPTHPTPMGVFSVIQKNRHHVSNLYGAPMPYMQRLTWSGTAMHTGPLPGYPASHGCIRLPDEFAQLLWKATRIGARVIVTRDEVKPVEIAHPWLPAPAPPAADAAAERPPETVGAPVRTAAASSDGALPALVVDRRTGPVSIFISRRERKLYVRQAMQPLFDLPLTLREPDRPLGTHVYTAMEIKDGAMRWTAVSIPSSFARAPLSPPDAAAALERIELPEAARERIASLITPGASLIVSDNPLSGETGRTTDFIVLTR